eukprot:2680511-Karenia_brevis.AAC.1
MLAVKRARALLSDSGAVAATAARQQIFWKKLEDATIDFTSLNQSVWQQQAGDPRSGTSSWHGLRSSCRSSSAN